MSSLKISEFLFIRLQETITHKEYIREVSIGCELDESFDNEYIRLTYKLEPNELWEKLSLNDTHALFEGSPHYIFSIEKHSQQDSSVRRKLHRIVEFKYIYESLSSNAAFVLEKGLCPGTAIKIASIDLSPEFNYAEERITRALPETFGEWETYRSLAHQWSELHALSIESRAFYLEKKTKFNTTDTDVCEKFKIPLTHLRRLFLKYKVPIKVTGTKIIEEVQVYTPGLADGLKRWLSENENSFWWRDEKSRYEDLIYFLYDHRLRGEKKKIVNRQRTAFLDSWCIQPGDVLQLTNGRIVLANETTLDSADRILVTYVLLKTNLQPGNRTRTVPMEQVSCALQRTDFESYLRDNRIRRLSLLERWMKTRKTKVTESVFEPDLLRP